MPTALIENLVVDPRCQSRVTLNTEAVEEYAELYAAGVDLGPIDVFDVGGVHYVVDGFHRRAARLLAGESFAVFRLIGQGTMEEAIWAATGANRVHGVKRTREDKRRAVLLALESGVCADQSNGVIARHVGVSDVYVGRIRAEWEAEHLPRTDEVRTRVGADGKRREVKPRAPKTASEPRLCQGCRSLDGEHDFGPTCTVEDGGAFDDPFADVPALADAPVYVLVPAWGVELSGHEAALRSVRLKARQLPDELHGLKQRLEVGLKGLENALVAAIPEACPACGGDGCARCEGRGWVPEAVAREMRERAESRA